MTLISIENDIIYEWIHESRNQSLMYQYHFIKDLWDCVGGKQVFLDISIQSMWNKFSRTGKSDGNNLREINKFTNVSCWNKITQRLRQRTSNKILRNKGKDPNSQLKNQLNWIMKTITMNTNLIHNSTVFLPLFLVIFLTNVTSSPVTDTGNIYE